MSHEKTIQDGKKKKSALKSWKERRAERKAKREEVKHDRKPRVKFSLTKEN